jgi:hypothetical protein
MCTYIRTLCRLLVLQAVTDARRPHVCIRTYVRTRVQHQVFDYTKMIQVYVLRGICLMRLLVGDAGTTKRARAAGADAHMCPYCVRPTHVYVPSSSTFAGTTNKGRGSRRRRETSYGSTRSRWQTTGGTRGASQGGIAAPCLLADLPLGGRAAIART